MKNIIHDREGRFVVSLPRRAEKSYLGDSLHGAICRFQSLEFKFKQNPILYKDYSEFMSEYLKLGHMSPLNDYDLSLDKSDIFYLPHPAVLKGSSLTTKSVSYTHLDVYKRQPLKLRYSA